MTAIGVPQRRDLPNKPLLEAVFELRWRLAQESPVVAADAGFQLFQGQYYAHVRERYPHVVRLPAAGIPESMAPYMVRQQFRAGPEAWPVTQIGPGILTVNDTTNYRWETFLPLIQQAIQALFESYPIDISPLQLTEGKLRYINTLKFPTKNLSLLAFLRDRLHISVELEPMLFGEGEDGDDPKGFSLNAAYHLTEPAAMGGVEVSLGEANGSPCIIFEILVRTLQEPMPQTADELVTWIQRAHDVVDKWFFALTRGSLLEEFEQPNAS